MRDARWGVVLAIAVCVFSGSTLPAAEDAVPIDRTETHLQAPTSEDYPGRIVPSFFSRAVTGPLKNKSVCYVCRNGNRPVVMVVARKLGPELQKLLQGVDELVDENRADGLRSFAVLVSDEPAQAVSAVQTFAFDGKLSLPMTVAPAAVAGDAGLQLSDQAEVTVLLYRELQVVESFAFRSAELDARSTGRVLAAVQQFIRDASKPDKRVSEKVER